MKKTISLNGKWDFNFNGKASKINVPGNWLTEGFDISGKAEYSREFKLVKKKGSFYSMVFKGVDYFADVYVNGKLAGKHEGYFQTFEFDVTALLKNGVNTVKVLVDSPKESKEAWPDNKYLIKGIFNHHDTRPGSWNKEHGQDMNTGGIWNNVELQERGAVQISRVKITPVLKDNGVWNFGTEIKVIFKGSAPSEAVFTQSYEGHNFKSTAVKSEKKAMLYPGENTVFIHSDVKNPRLWYSHDIGKPDMYAFTIKAAAGKDSDNFSDTAALRQFKLSEDKFWYLNGKRIYLRGSNIIPTQWLSTYSPAMIKKDVSMIKDANLNMIRIHAHVNREELLKALDEAGIMVWQDFALQWSYEPTAAFMENAVSQIKDMVNMFYNRASVVIWCCHNEPTFNERELDPVLYRAAIGEDPVRHVMQMSDFKQHHYPGWYYDDNFINAVTTVENAKKGGVISEYGAQALPRMENMKKMMPSDKLWPIDWAAWEFHDFQHKTTFDVVGLKADSTLTDFIEESQKYQAALIKEQTEAFRLNRYAVGNGVLQFMFVDCWPSITWSVVDSDRKPKLGYFAMKQAMQSVLPGFRKFVNNIKQGDDMCWGPIWKMVYVINDTHETMEEASFRLTLTGPDDIAYFDERSKKFNVLPDSIAYPFEKDDTLGYEQFKIAPDAKTGMYKIKVELLDKKGKVIAVNTDSINVVKRPKGA